MGLHLYTELIMSHERCNLCCSRCVCHISIFCVTSTTPLSWYCVEVEGTGSWACGLCFARTGINSYSFPSDISFFAIYISTILLYVVDLLKPLQSLLCTMSSSLLHSGHALLSLPSLVRGDTSHIRRVEFPNAELGLLWPGDYNPQHRW